MKTGEIAHRSRMVTALDIERFTEITATVQVVEVRPDKPIARLRTTVANQHGQVVLDGSGLVWCEPLSQPAPSTRPHRPVHVPVPAAV